MMKVTATRPTYVETENGERLLKKGDSAEVDGRKYGNNHPFVKAGYLVANKADSDDARPSGSGEPPITVEDVTGEDGVFTVQASDGVVFQPAKNQVREDGTLTSGGMKAYEEAKAKAEAEGGEE